MLSLRSKTVRFLCGMLKTFSSSLTLHKKRVVLSFAMSMTLHILPLSRTIGG